MKPCLMFLRGPNHCSIHEVVAIEADADRLEAALHQIFADGKAKPGLSDVVALEVTGEEWPELVFIKESKRSEYYSCSHYDNTGKHRIRCVQQPDYEEMGGYSDELARVTKGNIYTVLTTEFAHPEIDYMKFKIKDDNGDIKLAFGGYFENYFD